MAINGINGYQPRFMGTDPYLQQMIGLSQVNSQANQPIITATNPIQQDTIEISTKQAENKKGLSKGAKIGLGALATAAVAGAIYFATKGKVKPQQLVEFKPAKTVEEAIKFGEEKFGLMYRGCEKANLDMLNATNEMFAKNTKSGKLFDCVQFGACGEFSNIITIENPMAFSPVVYNGKTIRVLHINTDYINKFDEFISDMFKSHGTINLKNIISKDKNGLYTLVKPEYSSESLNRLVEQLNKLNSKTGYKEKMEIYDGFSELISNYKNILQGNNTMRNYAFDSVFIHESGHSIHCSKNSKLFNDLMDENNPMFIEFQKDNNIQKIAGQVSEYAKNEPVEFVAEVYARMVKGEKLSDDVMKLYEKYGGPKLG